jgi:hypothetical protein
MRESKLFPIQVDRFRNTKNVVPESVYMAAYEVYCHIFRPQEALITGECRGGFGIGELVGFLYARQFPKSEWEQRVNEAFKGMSL